MEILCYKHTHCLNYPLKCDSCVAMSHFTDPHPYYEQKEVAAKKIKVKIFNSIYEERLEDVTNDFIADKNVVDIKYNHCPNSHSVLIIYKED